MRTIVLALAVATAPAMALACDSPSGSNSATFILREGDTTWLIGSIKDLKRNKSKLRGHGRGLVGQHLAISDERLLCLMLLQVCFAVSEKSLDVGRLILTSSFCPAAREVIPEQKISTKSE